MPAYRDDREALLLRADALERDLERMKREAAELREENQELRARVATPAEPTTTPEPEGEPTMPPLPARRLDPAAMIGTLAAWGLVAIGAGASAWMIPVAFTSALLLGTLSASRLRTGPIATLKRPDPKPLPAGLPIDRKAYRELLETTRRTLNVQIDVKFEWPLQATERSEVEQTLARDGLATSWEQDTLELRSRRLRIVRMGEDGMRRDRSPIVGYCEGAFAALARLHQDREIAEVIPRVSKARARKKKLTG